MKKTLGGDRLGAGKKMQVELKNFGRSTHDLSYLWRSTMSAGTLVPFMSEIALPGDSWDIGLRANIMTHPTVGPLFGSYKVQLDVFLAPIRLYNSWLHNNRLNIGLNMAQVKFPILRMTPQVIDDATDIDNAQINPSALLAYLGLRGIGAGAGTAPDPDPDRDFNGIPFLVYWDIYKQYYSNKSEEIGACLHTPAVALIETIDLIEVISGSTNTGVAEFPATGAVAITMGDRIQVNFTGTEPLAEQVMIKFTNRGLVSVAELSGWFLVDVGLLELNPYFGANDIIEYWRYRDITDLNNGRPAVATFPLENIDLMRDAILTEPGNTPLDIIGVGVTPYTWANQIVGSVPNGTPSALSSQELLGLKTYQSDLFNNWLNTEWIDGTGGINEITAISTVGDSFEINALILGRKVYDMLNQIAVSGGSYNDWLDAVYTEDRRHQIESPMYMGGMIQELIFQEVVSNSASADGQPLGTLAGRGQLSGKKKGGNLVIKVDEPSYIMGIISLTPRIDNSQGNRWDMHLQTMDDLHKPHLDEIGFQELITEQMAWWDTTWDGAEWITKSAGKQPAWINYMTNVNRTFGNFAIADNEMFMTLNRRYEREAGTIGDLTTYIDPSKFNFIFAETALDAQNFWAQIAVDITARRKMSAKIMPNL